MEFLLIGIIVFFVLIYNNKINTSMFLDDNQKYFDLLKEKDYEFLLKIRYGDAKIDSEALYMKRIRNGLIVTIALIFVFITNLSFINIIIACLLGFIVFKSDYNKLKGYYKKHLKEIDSLLPYYLKSLEILIQHYTVPVALARSVEDAPEVFKPGLRTLIGKIEAGDSSIQPYMDFAQEYPVRDSMRMMRLLYRLGLGEQEKKHEQLNAFARTVSSLQNKAREQKYKARLEKMEAKTMAMLVCTGGGTMLLLLISIFMLMGSSTGQ